MKSIIEILTEHGVTVPEDKLADINKAVAENYKTVAEHEKKVARLEAERDGYKEQADTAAKTLEKFGDMDPEKVKAELAEHKKKAEDAEAAFKQQLEDRDREDALMEAIKPYQFSSEYAKKAVLDTIRGKKLPIHEKQLLGFTDFIEQIKKADPSAFVDPNDPKPKFTNPKSAGTPEREPTISEVMRKANENPDLDFSQYIH